MVRIEIHPHFHARRSHEERRQCHNIPLTARRKCLEHIVVNQPVAFIPAHLASEHEHTLFVFFWQELSELRIDGLYEINRIRKHCDRPLSIR